MADATLRQGDVIAGLSNLCYRPHEGFQEDNTWHVTEASLSADSDTKLGNGPATVIYDGTEFAVTVSVLELETLPGDECEEPHGDNPACAVEIGYADGLPKLAVALGLL